MLDLIVSVLDHCLSFYFVSSKIYDKRDDFDLYMWDLIVSVPDHCLSFYFVYQRSCGCAVWWP